MNWLPASGVLLHPTSLPGRFGVGDLGPEAYRWVDWLAEAGQKIWQFLPLCPNDEHGSPYCSPSTLAGNTILISPEKLVELGLLDADELKQAELTADEPDAPVDYRAVARTKRAMLEAAYARFVRRPRNEPLHERFRDFRDRHAWWLEGHAAFITQSELEGTGRWTAWPKPNDPAGLADQLPAERLDMHRFGQFLFFQQWEALRRHAANRQIRLVGDLPIYVDHQSADVWAHRELFQLDADGEATAIAGVPPDYFSTTGQLWGNPLYDWEAMRLDHYRWWTGRIRAVLDMVDLVRLDHFRGFEAYWSVPAGSETAVDGRWLAGPGDALLEALRRDSRRLERKLPGWRSELPIIAEDLGLITPEVHALRNRFDLPGMVVLQFTVCQPEDDPFDFEAIHPNTVVYTGTHDNDTTRGWLVNDIQPDPPRCKRVRRYVSDRKESVAWELLTLAWQSRARLAVAPLQDVLGLGSEARMNRPGVQDGNWQWRYAPEMLTAALGNQLAELTADSGR